MEYKRLSYHTPHCQTSELKKHTDQVLHVSFAHNGTMFATCSKDGYVVVSVTIEKIYFFTLSNTVTCNILICLSGLELQTPSKNKISKRYDKILLEIHTFLSI